MEDASEQKLIQLEPFAHQVGGHSSMLCVDGATVAKPLVAREQLFYETLPAPLRPFVPSFHGALEVHVLQAEGGYVTHAATPPPHYRPHVGIRTRRSRIRLHDSGDIEIEGENEGMVFEDDDEDREQVAAKAKEDDLFQVEDEEMRNYGRGPRTSVSHALNPWVLRCHKESLSGLIPGMSQHLKVGTRQYGDSASPAKVRSKMMKVATTTSGKLGIRLGGMQVYQVTTRHFLCRNKLFGRALTVEGFRMALVQFLHNGWCIRLDVVRPLLERLEMLESILTRLGAARFYTCSLLCLYEGELRTPSTTPLSPSTPAPPMTPGPLSSMPPSFFSSSSNRFNFSNIFQPSAETSTSFTSLPTKFSETLAKGNEKSAFNSESAKFPPPSNTHPCPDTVTPSASDSKVSHPRKSDISGDQPSRDSSVHFTIGQECDEAHTIHSDSDTHLSYSLNGSSFTETPESSCLVNEASALAIKETPSQENNVTQAPTIRPLISSNNTSTLPQNNNLSESGVFSRNEKPSDSPLHPSGKHNLCPSCTNPLFSKGVGDSLGCCTSHQNSEAVHRCASPPETLATKAKIAIMEDQVTKSKWRESRKARETLGRSVSADSVSYTKDASRSIPRDEERSPIVPQVKELRAESKSNGYTKGDKEEWLADHKGFKRERSQSLEPLISLYASNGNCNPHFDDGSLSCYNSITAMPLVDVRLIDFAHSTHKGLSDPVSYAGPDQGFLFGLHNLINLLRDIAQEAMTATEKF